MTEEQIKQIQNEIALAASAASPFVSLLGPSAVAALVVGSAVAKQLPELVAIIQRWVGGQPPTSEEFRKMDEQLAVLSNPNLP